jgi:diguanylate cyclase (GGDEF)-like protein
VAIKITAGQPSPILSLRWKTLITLSLILAVVNGSLAYYAYQQLFRQFDVQQAQVRERQEIQFNALFADRFRQMSRIGNLVPLLAPLEPHDDLRVHLTRALQAHGITLDLEWDIRSVHWLNPEGSDLLLWPEGEAALPAQFIQMIGEQPEQTHQGLACGDDCRQYLSVPLLWDGEYSGALILGRTVADALLAFHALTGAEAAVVACEQAPCSLTGMRAVTHPQISRSLFERAWTTEPLDSVSGSQVDRTARVRSFQVDDAWYESFRIDLGPGLEGLVLNNISSQRRAITIAARQSVAIGLLGLVLTEILMLVILHGPLARLRRLATRLPLLAEQSFDKLRESISSLLRDFDFRDEIDLVVETVATVADQMEGLERDRQKAQDDLVWLADHDSLTNLLNRRGFNRESSRLINDARLKGEPGALFFIDLDRFKDVNELSGHQLGDSLLEGVAGQLEDVVGNRGIIGRLGGDEFAVVLNSADRYEAEKVAGELTHRIQEVVVVSNKWRHQVTASIGIVLFPEHGLGLQQLMADADLAMSQAKEKGRGRWHIFSPDDKGRERANARLVWSQKISAALSDGLFELHLQPIMEVATGKVWRAEGLLRMRDPACGFISPGNFIPVAEETGQIQEIDQWVLNRAFGLLATRDDFSLSVNLSASAMQDNSLLPTLETLSAKHRVRPEHLTLEITESVAVNSLRNTARLMDNIQRLGCRFALDDFGSGFASYSYLKQLPVNDIKIDGAFIRDILDNREDRIFVGAITDMAHGMDKRVIAEFVENERVLDTLRTIKVDFAQGYHIGRAAAPIAA